MYKWEQTTPTMSGLDILITEDGNNVAWAYNSEDAEKIVLCLNKGD